MKRIVLRLAVVLAALATVVVAAPVLYGLNLRWQNTVACSAIGWEKPDWYGSPCLTERQRLMWFSVGR